MDDSEVFKISESVVSSKTGNGLNQGWMGIMARWILDHKDIAERLEKVKRDRDELMIECRGNLARQTWAKEIIKRENFVFDNLDDRWQKLAFTFYTELLDIQGKSEDAITSIESGE